MFFGDNLVVSHSQSMFIVRTNATYVSSLSWGNSVNTFCGSAVRLFLVKIKDSRLTSPEKTLAFSSSIILTESVNFFKLKIEYIYESNSRMNILVFLHFISFWLQHALSLRTSLRCLCWSYLLLLLHFLLIKICFHAANKKSTTMEILISQSNSDSVEIF